MSHEGLVKSTDKPECLQHKTLDDCHVQLNRADMSTDSHKNVLRGYPSQNKVAGHWVVCSCKTMIIYNNVTGRDEPDILPEFALKKIRLMTKLSSL